MHTSGRSRSALAARLRTQHGGDEDGAWILLEPTEPTEAAGELEPAAPGGGADAAPPMGGCE